MLAFHNDSKIKDYYLSRVKAHKTADEIIKGTYWEGGKGCAVGCTIHSSSHEDYEEKLGIPQILAQLEDVIFENLPNDLAKEWPLEFLSAINTGADLTKIWPQFARWLLIDEKYGVLQHAQNDRSKKIIINVSNAYSNYSSIKIDEWENLKSAAAAADAYVAANAAADYAAYAAADYAADAAAADYAADAAAADAADAAADAAANAAYDTTYTDTYTATYADATDEYVADAAAHIAAIAEAAARSKHYIAQSQKLLNLLRGEK